MQLSNMKQEVTPEMLMDKQSTSISYHNKKYKHI